MQIASTRVDTDGEGRQLVVTFTAKGKSDWPQEGLEQLLNQESQVAECMVDAPSKLLGSTSQCTVTIAPMPGVKFRAISVLVREMMAELCGCSLGDITLTERYDRIAERELTTPSLAPSSDVRFFDESPSRN